MWIVQVEQGRGKVAAVAMYHDKADAYAVRDIVKRDGYIAHVIYHPDYTDNLPN